jgi:AraC-like DNA-binding protein
MADVVRRIQECPGEDFQLRDLARQTHLSLSRFTAETGVSPGQFLVRTRIEASKRRLAEAAEPIMQIAMSLGFSSSQYFATVFKRITGATPRAYRCGSESRAPSRRRDDGQG